MSAAWDNAVAAMLTDSAFAEDLAAAVTNSGNRDEGARWFLALAAGFLRDRGRPSDPIAAYDFAICDWEALCRDWPVMHEAARILDARVILPALARFVAERLPAVWGLPAFNRHTPVTRAVVIADRADTLVAMFKAGLQPNGSKDPYALRRAAKHFLHQVVSTSTVGMAA